jgi:hypothetical protein
MSIDPALVVLRQQAFAKAAQGARVLAERFARSVLPVFRPDRQGLPDRIGSCALVRVDGRPFAFTAAHVVTDLADALLHVSPGPKGKLRPLPCRKAFFVTDAESNDFDIAVLPLVGADVTTFTDWSFLDQGDVDLQHQVDPLAYGRNSYSLFGYSASPSQVKVSRPRKHIRQQSFLFTGLPEDESVYRRESLNPLVHLVLEFDHKDIRVAGRRTTPPKLQGVSGGGIFHLVDLSANPTTRLVAIATEHRRSSRVVVGTRIEHFVALARAVIANEPTLFH